MPTQRVHPSKYNEEYYLTMQRAVEHGVVELQYMTAGAAKQERMNFYGARAALRKHSSVNPDLANASRHLSFKLNHHTLIIRDKRQKKATAK